MKKFRILVIDDEQDELDYTRSHPKAAGHGLRSGLMMVKRRLHTLKNQNQKGKSTTKLWTGECLVCPVRIWQKRYGLNWQRYAAGRGIGMYDVAQIEDEAKNIGITRFISKPVPVDCIQCDPGTAAEN